MSVTMMIDTHSHPLLCSRPLTDWFANAKAAGVHTMIGVATTIQMGLDTLALAKTHPELHPSIGIHPSEADPAVDLDQLSALLAQHPEFKAIGEIGLDFYHKDNPPYAIQRQVFEAQLNAARHANLPVILHSRNADTEILEVLANYSDVRKVFHCFSSGVEFLHKTNDDTTYFSFTGMVTYTNKAFLNEVIAQLPLEKMMIETDCPYLTPTAFDGQENQPAFVGEVAKKIAQVKNIPLDLVLRTTTQTAKTFFTI